MKFVGIWDRHAFIEFHVVLRINEASTSVGDQKCLDLRRYRIKIMAEELQGYTIDRFPHFQERNFLKCWTNIACEDKNPNL